jgi:exopolysaccharide biosynthesis polyprenyl glycosylphosphotransferase
LGLENWRRLSWALEGSGIKLLVAPPLTDVAGPRIVVRPAQGLPLLEIEEPEFRGANRVVKAIIDRVLAALFLVAFLPVMVVIAVVTKLSARGPIFYRQERVGKLGTSFVIWKFRTMTRDAEKLHSELLESTGHSGVLFKLTDDPRVTRFGRFLRRYSLDELPQLGNVILGSMSLVGPRPQRPFEVALYADHHRRRLLVKPGMTGLWQISGRSTLSWEEAVQLDLHYVDNWSVTRDLVILVKTAWAVVRSPGAY